MELSAEETRWPRALNSVCDTFDAICPACTVMELSASTSRPSMVSVFVTSADMPSAVTSNCVPTSVLTPFTFTRSDPAA